MLCVRHNREMHVNRERCVMCAESEARQQGAADEGRACLEELWRRYRHVPANVKVYLSDIVKIIEARGQQPSEDLRS